MNHYSMEKDNEQILDVLIAGAGPAGLMFASDLARWNVEFRIADKKEKPEIYTKAGNLWNRTQEVLAGVGLLDRVLAEAYQVETLSVYAYGKFLGHKDLATKQSPYQKPLLIGQNQIERILSEHLSEIGRAVDYNAELVALEQHADFVEATLQNKNGERETVRARYLVGCDGGKGFVRKQVGLDMEIEKMPNRAMRQCDIRLQWSRSTRPEQMWFFLLETGFCAFLPMPGGIHRIWIIQDDKDFPFRDPTLEEMQQAAREISGDPTVELSDPIWFSHSRFAHGVAPAFRRDRVFLCGDAGHYTLPIGGQGMNTGLQDAFNLGWKLAAVLQGRGTEILLDSYSVERQSTRQETDNDQKKGFDRLMYPSKFQRLFLNWFGSYLMQGGGGVETFAERDETMLSIEYPNSPLTEDKLGSRGIKAGMRAPDALVIETYSHQTKHLFDYIYDGKWTLLVFDDKDEQAIHGNASAIAKFVEQFPDVDSYFVASAPIARPQLSGRFTTLLDTDGFAHQAFEITTPTLFLIRPDGHIGFRGAAKDISALTNYSQRFFSKS